VSASPSRSFPGQPPPGAMYYGSSGPRHMVVTDWEKELGNTLAVRRSFFTPEHHNTAHLLQRCQEDVAHNRLPHVSYKPPWTWASIAAGEQDRWLTEVLGAMDQQHSPIFFTLHHEPENDAGPEGMAAADYVAMQQRVQELATTLAPMVTVVPVLQQWTFDPMRDDIDPSEWIVPDALAIGLDLYNQWSPTNGNEWRSFGSKASEVRDWFGDTPMVIGEYGCRIDRQMPGLAAEWMRDAADYALKNNFVSMSYFNSRLNSPDGTWELEGETEEAFAELLGSPWVARPQ
jgi:hypothetical protein